MTGCVKFASTRALPDPEPAFAHPLFWKGSPEQLYPGTSEAPLRFLAELEEMAAGWRSHCARPYPFDCDPLPLLLPAVAVTVPFEPPTAFAS